MLKNIIILLLFSITTSLLSQKPAYKIYNSHGKNVSYEKMVKQLSKSDIILFGEIHDNPIAQWLEIEVTTDLHKKRNLILGAEMIETDNQNELNQYLDNTISYDEFDSRARLWRNHKTAYALLVDYARENQIPFIATNIPRRYAKMVYKGGFEALDTVSTSEKEWIAPLPVPFDAELATYQNILDMMGEHGTPDLVKAQAIKDATMAHFILKNYVTDQLFIHYNGAYHSDYYEGILWYLKKARADLNYATISTKSQVDINKLLKENKNVADFIICVDSDMTKTY